MEHLEIFEQRDVITGFHVKRITLPAVEEEKSVNQETHWDAGAMVLVRDGSAQDQK